MVNTQQLKEHCDLRRLVEQDLGPARCVVDALIYGNAPSIMNEGLPVWQFGQMVTAALEPVIPVVMPWQAMNNLGV